MQCNPRYKIFIDKYSQSGNILQSAITAGFSDIYARKQGKRILNTALKIQANEMLARSSRTEVKATEGKQLMHAMIGMSRNELLNNVKWLATQEKDLATRLKVIKPLVKEIDIDLSDEIVSNTTVPILNISVSKNDTPNDGLTEPPMQGDSK